MTENDGFLKRWSRLKLVVSNPPAPAPPVAAVVPMPAPEPLAEFEEDDDQPLAVEESPYSALLRTDMPDDLRNQALRSLWRSEPVFSDSDGMTDYGDDYRAPSMIGGDVKSAWQAGRGYDEPAESEVAAAGDDAPSKP